MSYTGRTASSSDQLLGDLTFDGVINAGVNITRTFYASSTNGGSNDYLNTVTMIDGVIVSWTQETVGVGAGSGEPLGLLLALTQA